MNILAGACLTVLDGFDEALHGSTGCFVTRSFRCCCCTSCLKPSRCGACCRDEDDKLDSIEDGLDSRSNPRHPPDYIEEARRIASRRSKTRTVNSTIAYPQTAKMSYGTLDGNQDTSLKAPQTLRQKQSSMVIFSTILLFPL